MAAHDRPSAGASVADAMPSDLDALAALMAASPLLQRYGVTPGSARESLARAFEAGDLLLVCRDAPDPAPLGFGWLIRTRILDVGAYLRLLLVDEGLQGRGVGRRIMDVAEERARSWANHLYLLTTIDNLGARRFYERRGYRHVGDLPELVRPGIDESLYHMVLRPFGERLSL